MLADKINFENLDAGIGLKAFVVLFENWSRSLCPDGNDADKKGSERLDKDLKGYFNA